MITLNERYNVTPKWKLRIRYIPRFGTFLEAYSKIKESWVICKKLSSWHIKCFHCEMSLEHVENGIILHIDRSAAPCEL